MKKEKVSSGILAITSCKDTTKESSSDAMDDSEQMIENNHMESAMDGSQLVPEFENKAVTNVFEHYTHLKDALINSDPEEAKMGAKMLNDALIDIKGSDTAQEAAKGIAGSADL